MQQPGECDPCHGNAVRFGDRLDGVDDGLQLTRESLRMLADDRRTHTVARKHLEEALSAHGRIERVEVRPEAELEGVTAVAVLESVLATVPVPR